MLPTSVLYSTAAHTRYFYYYDAIISWRAWSVWGKILFYLCKKYFHLFQLNILWYQILDKCTYNDSTTLGKKCKQTSMPNSNRWKYFSPFFLPWTKQVPIPFMSNTSSSFSNNFISKRAFPSTSDNSFHRAGMIIWLVLQSMVSLSSPRNFPYLLSGKFGLLIVLSFHTEYCFCKTPCL